MKMIFEHAYQYNEHKYDTMRLINWANEQTDKGYCALHYAAYHGNMEMIEFLVDHMEVDMFARNKKDQNVLHMAAQGD